MRTGKRRRPLLRSAAAVLALVTAAGAGLSAAPAPARAADTVRGLQWYLDTLRISEAHKLTRGEGVTVAVVDGGVHAAHPALRGQVLKGTSLSDAVPADGRSDPDREAGHGTKMAGVIAGRGGGSMTQLGIAPGAKILPVALGLPREWDIAGGIRWAVDHGADVINLSIGGEGSDPQVTEAVRYALDKGVVLVAAAGNRPTNRAVPMPANIPGVLAVSAVGRTGSLWSGSITGPEVGLAAPGERVIGPVPPPVSPNGYGVASGSSDAAAVVSGAAALVRSRYPDLDAANVVNRLIRTARDRGASGRDPEYGFGTLDVLAALTASVPKVGGNPLLTGASPKPDAAGGDEGDDDGDDGPPVTIGLADNAPIQLGLCLLAVLLIGAVVVALIVVNRRAARRRAQAAPANRPPGVPTPGYGQPPGAPSGYGPPPGRPAQQHPYQPGPAGRPAAPPPYGGQGLPPPGPGGRPGPQPGGPAGPPTDPQR
ncbi:S8 family serine peptidase [Micromonospora okii]|uniref:S8 family serine peptidase n=1 Tax=Micromonospora okii TaxID=1182970 RepID=UPI001E481168|nr:S8 family serine peptidase [Micromonospora okii]